MIIKQENGCYSSILSIDNVAFEDCNQKELRSKLLEFLKDADLEDLTKLILNEYGNMISDDSPCEQCGNWGSTTTLEI